MSQYRAAVDSLPDEGMMGKLGCVIPGQFL